MHLIETTDSMSGVLIQLGLPTDTTVYNSHVLLVVARCHAIRSLSGSQILLCGNLFSVVFFSLFSIF